MSDIRFEGWLHRSGTGGVYQDAAGNVGIASTQPQQKLDIGNGGFQVGPTGITTVTTINTTNITNSTPLSNRNYIINGAMQIAQRGQSFSVTGSYTNYTLDRFITENNHDGASTFTQSSTAPDGFKNSLKIDVTTADTSLATTHYMQVQQRVEAQNLQGLSYGTSDAKAITFSFFVRSNKTGDYSFTLQQNDNGNRQMPSKYTINSANTWERKIITVPADTSGAFNDDNGIGLIITWGLSYGSAYTSGSVSADNSFKTYNQADFGAGQGVNLLDSTSNEWYLTGVQMELGEVATPYEYKTYAQELNACMRYYEGIFMGPGTALMRTYQNNAGSPSNCTNVEYNFKVEKRAEPTWSVEGNAVWQPSNSTTGMSAYPSKSTCIFQRNDTSAQFFSDANGDLCGSFSSEL